MQTLTAVSPTGRTDVPLDQNWIPDSTDLIFSPPNADGSGTGFVVYSDTAEVRMTPSFDGTFNDRIAPPVVVSQQLADVFDIGVGDTVTFALQDGVDRLDAEIVSVVPAIPGAPTNIALLIDLGVIQHFQLRTTDEPARARDVWVRTDEPETVAHEVRALFPANAQIDTAVDAAGRQVLGSATTTLWAGAAGCGILALIGVAVAARAQLRSRRGEVAVLRAIGLGPGAQAGIRARELGVVIGTGLLAGLAAGAIVALLTVPQLARAAIPAPYPVIGTRIGIDLIGLGVALGGLIVAGQLDSTNAEAMMSLIAALVHQRGVAAIVSTHDPRMAAHADRIIEIHDGRVGRRRGRHASDAEPDTAPVRIVRPGSGGVERQPAGEPEQHDAGDAVQPRAGGGT